MRFNFAAIFLAVAVFAEEAAETRELGHKKSGYGFVAPIAHGKAPVHGKTTPLQATKHVPTTAGSIPAVVLAEGPIPAHGKAAPATARWLGKKKGGYNYGAGYGTYYAPPPTPVFPIPEPSKKGPAFPAPVVKTVIPQPPVVVGKGKKQVQIAQPPKVKFAPAPIAIQKKGHATIPKKLRKLGKKKGYGYAAPVVKAAPIPTKKQPTVAWGVPTQHKKAAPAPTKKTAVHGPASLGAYPAAFA